MVALYNKAIKKRPQAGWTHHYVVRLLWRRYASTPSKVDGVFEPKKGSVVTKVIAIISRIKRSASITRHFSILNTIVALSFCIFLNLFGCAYPTVQNLASGNIEDGDRATLYIPLKLTGVQTLGLPGIVANLKIDGEKIKVPNGHVYLEAGEKLIEFDHFRVKKSWFTQAKKYLKDGKTHICRGGRSSGMGLSDPCSGFRKVHFFDNEKLIIDGIGDNSYESIKIKRVFHFDEGEMYSLEELVDHFSGDAPSGVKYPGNLTGTKWLGRDALHQTLIVYEFSGTGELIKYIRGGFDNDLKSFTRKRRFAIGKWKQEGSGRLVIDSSNDFSWNARPDFYFDSSDKKNIYVEQDIQRHFYILNKML